MIKSPLGSLYLQVLPLSSLRREDTVLPTYTKYEKESLVKIKDISPEDVKRWLAITIGNGVNPRLDIRNLWNTSN